MPHALIQLVSEQTLPNILPALALKPARIALLHTPQTRRQCDWISTALRTAGHTIEIELFPLSDHPDHHTTGQAVRQVITAHRTLGLNPVVNFTGGTKLMSIGAFAAANAEKAPNFYFDTTARQIYPGTTLALPAPLDSSATAFRLIAAQLSVSILTAAHGINHFIPGRDPAAWLPLSRLLAADPKLEQATHAFATTTLYEHNRRPEDYHRILETPLDDIPDALVEPLVDAHHIQLRDGHWHLAHPAADCFRRWAAGERYENHQIYYAATAPLQQLIGFLSGGWWELAVLDAARVSGRFRDLHWSPKCNRPDTTSSIEEDLLGLEDLSLVLISCKRGGDRSRLLRAVEELDSAGRSLGGHHTRRHLAVATPLPKYLADELKARCASTHTQLIGPASKNLTQLFAPPHAQATS